MNCETDISNVQSGKNTSWPIKPWFNGSACIFSTFAHLIYTSLLRLNSNIYQKILQIFFADIWVFFRRQIDKEKFALNGSILFKQLHLAIQVNLYWLCVSLERKGAAIWLS